MASYLLIGVVIFAPFPFGSTDQISIAFWVIILSVIVVALLPARFTRAEWGFFGCMGGVGAAWCTITFIQLAPSELFGGAFDHPIWSRASQALGSTLQPAISAARDRAFFSAAPQLSCFLALLCGFLAGRSRSRAKRILLAVAISATLYALLAIALFTHDPTTVLWRQKLAYRNLLTGTFTNRNTAAVYFGSFAVIWLSILSDEISKGWSRRARGFVEGLSMYLRHPSRIAIGAAISLPIVMSAMFMTSSRAGVILSLGAMLGSQLTLHRKRLSSTGALMGALVLGVAIALVLLQILGISVTNRFDPNNAADLGRLYVYEATAGMISQFPWFGTGLGTFALVFPAYRTSDITTWGTWDRAHSTPLEIAAEQGVPFALLVVLGFLLAQFLLFRGISMPRRGRIVPLCAFWVAALAGAHSLVDFSLQIPAVAILVFTLIGIGLAQSIPRAIPLPETTLASEPALPR